MVKANDKKAEIKRLQLVLATAVAQQDFYIAANAKNQLRELQQAGVWA